MLSLLFGSVPLLGTAIKFLMSPLGRIVGVALAVVVAYNVVYYRGYSKANAACTAAAEQARLAAVKIDLNTARQQAADAQKAVAELQALEASNKEKLDALREQLNVKGSDALLDGGCNYTPAGVRVRSDKDSVK